MGRPGPLGPAAGHRARAGPGGFAGHGHLAGQAEPEVPGGPRGVVTRGEGLSHAASVRRGWRPGQARPCRLRITLCYPQAASLARQTRPACAIVALPAPGVAGRIGGCRRDPSSRLDHRVRAICLGRAVVAGPDDLRGGSGRCGRSGQLGRPDMKARPSARSGLPSNPPRVLDSRMRREDVPLASTAIRVGHNRPDERPSRSRSVTSGHIVISSNNYRAMLLCLSRGPDDISVAAVLGLRGWVFRPGYRWFADKTGMGRSR